MNRRFATIVWGLVPVAVLTTLITSTHIPGTNIDLSVPLGAEGPGPTFNTLGSVDGEEVVSIHGRPTDPTSGQLLMTTVAVRHNMPLSQAISRWLTTDDTIVPLDTIFPVGKSEEEVEQANKAAFTSSENSATTAALNYLGEPIVVKVADTVEDSPAAGVLQEGDEIAAVNGQEVTTPGQVQKMIRELSPGDTVDIAFLRDGVKENATITLGPHPEDDKVAQLGVYMSAESASGITVDYNLQDIGGPSAGLVFSLTVIDKLTPGELTGGATIAGTGTIDGDGAVGPIGGITHKIDAAAAQGAQAFLVPEGNCAEALKGPVKDVPLLAVKDLDGAVSAVKDFAADKMPKTCQEVVPGKA